MTKSELKTGMIVILRDGKEYMVFKGVEHNLEKNSDVLVATDGSNSWFKLSSYNENMTQQTYPEYDIVKVMRTHHPYSLITPDYEKEKRQVIWPRKKRYTYAQLREILGEEFEVVG